MGKKRRPGSRCPVQAALGLFDLHPFRANHDAFAPPAHPDDFIRRSFGSRPKRRRIAILLGQKARAEPYHSHRTWSDLHFQQTAARGRIAAKGESHFLPEPSQINASLVEVAGCFIRDGIPQGAAHDLFGNEFTGSVSLGEIIPASIHKRDAPALVNQIYDFLTLRHWRAVFRKEAGLSNKAHERFSQARNITRAGADAMTYF
jgi:hypothetical protein